MGISEMLELMETGGDWQKEVPVRSLRFGDDAVRRYMELMHNKADKPRHQWEYELREAMATTDFPGLMSTVLDRQMLAEYQAMEEPPYNPIFRHRPGDIADLTREVYSLNYTGDLDALQEVVEGDQYLEHVAPAETLYHYKLKKWGKRYKITWEASLADNIGMLDRLPRRLATAARLTESYLQSSLLMGAAGWNAAATALGAAAATALSEANLAAAIAAMTGANTNFWDNNWPIVVKPRYLVVTPLLALTAKRILVSSQWQGVGTAGAVTQIGNLNLAMEYDLRLVVDPMIPKIATNGTLANTMWGLFAEKCT